MNSHQWYLQRVGLAPYKSTHCLFAFDGWFGGNGGSGGNNGDNGNGGTGNTGGNGGVIYVGNGGTVIVIVGGGSGETFGGGGNTGTNPLNTFFENEILVMVLCSTIQLPFHVAIKT